MNRKIDMRRVLRCTLLCFHLNLLSSHVAQAQKITLKGNEVQLTTVFAQIFKQTGYTTVGASELLNRARPINVNVKDLSLDKFLTLILKDQGLLAKIDGKTIIITAAKAKTVNREIQADSLIYVSGYVRDPEGKGIQGVSLRVDRDKKMIESPTLKGQPREWRTDNNGRFRLICLKGEDILFSSLGYDPQRITFDKSVEGLMIVLEQTNVRMEEAVVNGIFSRKAESFTGSAQTFTKEQLFQAGNANVIQSLKNIDPSFNVFQNLSVGSNPNVMPSIQLRGQSGFPDLRGEYQTDPNQPLFILDGFESSLVRIMDLDMNRIKSVTILKDAAAKAIYGSKAANGVVVIETEMPKAGKMRLSYNSNINISTPDLSSYNLTNASEKLQVERDAGLFIAAPGRPQTQFELNTDYNRLLEAVLSGTDTDWLRKPVRTGVGQKHSLRAEGGNEHVQYGVDFALNNVAGVMKGSDRNTLSGGISLAYRTSKIAIRNELSTQYNRGINSPYGSFDLYANMNPYFRSIDENGNILKIAGQSINTGVVGNPIWNTTLKTKDFDHYLQFLNNFYAEWFVSKSWKIVGRASVMRQETGSELFHPANHTDFLTFTTPELLNRRGIYNYGDGVNTNLNTDLISSYTRSFGKHFLSLNANANLSSSTNRSVNFFAEGFPNDYLDDITFARQYQQNARPVGGENTTRDLGALVAVNYSFDDRYLFDGSYRANGSSQFGSDNRWGNFWSLGLGWNLHKEKFLKSWKNLDLLKIRGSVGYTGSQNFNSYQSRTTFSYNTSDTYLGSYGAYLVALGNNKLKWQRKFDQNIGIDLSAFNRRLMLRADFYLSNTDDLLTDVTLPSSTGFRSYKENLGEVQNRGYEFNINYRVWKSDNENNFISLFVAANHNKNKIRKISNSLAFFNDTESNRESNLPVVRYSEGQSMTAIWAVPSYGVDPSTGREILISQDGSTTNRWNPNDLQVVGDSQPTLRGNGGINVMYKGWNLNVAINWQFGGQLYNQTVLNRVENADLTRNVDKRVFDSRWRKQGDISWFKDIEDRSLTRATERFVQDQNEWTLSSVFLSYDLDRLSFVKRYPFKRFRVSVNMNDIATVSSIRLERGTSYPFARTFSFGIQTSF